MEKTGCKIICGAPTTLAVKGVMMMMMMNLTYNVTDVDQKTSRTEREKKIIIGVL